METKSALYATSRLLGLFPFDRSGGFDKFYSFNSLLIGVTFNSIIIATRIRYLIVGDRYHWGYEKCVSPILAILQALPVIVFIANLTRRKKSLDLYHLHNFNMNVAALHYKMSLLQNVALVFGAVSVVCFSVLSFCGYVEQTFQFVTKIFNSFQMYFIILIFYDFSRRTLTYLQIIKGGNVFLNQLRFLKCCEELMTIFQIPLLFIFINSFGYVIWYTFEVIYRCLYKQSFNNDHPLSTYLVYFAVFKLFTLVLPCVASQQFYDELDDHYNKIFNTMKGNPVLCKKASLYLYVTTKRKVKLSVCGFFTLGYPLITSIIAGCATYLVVLIQLSAP